MVLISFILLLLTVLDLRCRAGFSLVASGGVLAAVACGPLTGGSSCGGRALGRGLSTCGLSCTVTCAIFPDQELNRVPCVGRRTLYH